MPGFFSTHTRGLEELTDYISGLARQFRGVVTEVMSDDLIGTTYRGLKHYPAYKKVTRRAAFGRAFESIKQQRYVMGQIASGRIEPGYPHRTGRYQNSWERTGSGVGSVIEGELPHEGWPNRLAKRIGWRDPMVIISTNIAHAIQAAERAIQKLAK